MDPIMLSQREDKTCTETETEITPCTSLASQTKPNIRRENSNKKSEQQKSTILPLKIAKGVYPCRIGSCKVQLEHRNFNTHLRNDHKDVFYEFSAKGTTFTQEWPVNYSNNQNYDFIFYIKEMGLLFLNVSIHEKGDLTAFVQIINSVRMSKRFTYTLEAGNGPNHVSYTGLVQSCRIKRKSRTKNCLYIPKDIMQNIIENKTSFHCNLTIKRKINNKKIVDQGIQSDKTVPQ